MVQKVKMAGLHFFFMSIIYFSYLPQILWEVSTNHEESKDRCSLWWSKCQSFNTYHAMSWAHTRVGACIAMVQHCLCHSLPRDLQLISAKGVFWGKGVPKIRMAPVSTWTTPHLLLLYITTPQNGQCLHCGSIFWTFFDLHVDITDCWCSWWERKGGGVK